MIWYHGTSKENWEKIQKEGFLFGRRYVRTEDGTIIRELPRATYLTQDIGEAKMYGDVLLEVQYSPRDSSGRVKCDITGFQVNNYCDGCWQMRVYEPIKIENIIRIC